MIAGGLARDGGGRSRMSETVVVDLCPCRTTKPKKMPCDTKRLRKIMRFQDDAVIGCLPTKAGDKRSRLRCQTWRRYTGSRASRAMFHRTYSVKLAYASHVDVGVRFQKWPSLSF